MTVGESRLIACVKKRLSKRLFDAETLDGMSRSELVNIIFMPGFSTSPIITDLSGRGVGHGCGKKERC